MVASNSRKRLKHSKRTFGKSEAREQFLPLVDAVSSGAGPVEITERGRVVAVLISKTEYDWMAEYTKHKPQPARTLCGLGELVGDLEEGSAEIAAAFQVSLKTTAKKL